MNRELQRVGPNGVGSRFRATIHHMVSRVSENDSRPLPAGNVQDRVLTADRMLCLCAGPITMMDKPPFIASQTMRLLHPSVEQPRRFLQPEYFRSQRPGAAAPDAPPTVGAMQEAAWQMVDRQAVVDGWATLHGGTVCPLHRLVITTDAGIGKTKNMQWLNWQLNQPARPTVAFLIEPQWLDSPRGDWLDLLVTVLAKSQDPNVRQSHDLRRQVERWRQQGRLVVLFDALDQASEPTVRRLCAFFDPVWRDCRLIISGRPHALQRYWDLLFHQTADWRFLQLDEFTEPEQRQFLGQVADGAAAEQEQDRFDLIPEEARQILSVPRVLEYLRELTDEELTTIRTPSDVYWRATRRMIAKGLESHDARTLGGNSRDPAYQIALAEQLLAAIAFQMTGMPSPDSCPAAGTRSGIAPNFDRVPPGPTMEGFCQDVHRRVNEPHYQTRGYSGFRDDLHALNAMNSGLAYGFLDSELLASILWRNRSLQEFFTAVWLARYCDGQDVQRLQDWIYLPYDPVSDEYYWVWRFAAEMPREGRQGEAWVRSMSPLYTPGDGTWNTRRSNEMIYRSWPALEAYADGTNEPVANRDASAVRERFLGEFENQILAGKRGWRAWWTARRFVRSFITLPAGEFQMGSAEGKGGVRPEMRKYWTEWLRQGRSDPARHVDQLLAEFSWPPGREGRQVKQEYYRLLLTAHKTRDLNLILAAFYPWNEQPAERLQHVRRFLLSHSPTLNCWYRLYDPGHGLRESEYHNEYMNVSGRPDTPVIFATWYDAWTFCQWAYWDGMGCRLPQEHEWEYAAKAGTPWDWNYWWGDDLDPQKCNCLNEVDHVDRATVPSQQHANAWGFRDMLGNVNEWCDNWYQAIYNATGTNPGFARVLRGGSWRNQLLNARSACRHAAQPWDLGDDRGFRVARDAS